MLDKFKIKLGVFIMCVCVACVSQSFVYAEHKLQEYLPKPLPSGALHDLDNKEFSLDKLEGNVLLVHFWATWCSTCADQMKALNNLQKVLRKEPIIVIPISEDFKGVEVIKNFYHAAGLKYIPAFIDKNNKWFKDMKVANLPSTFIVDTEGNNVAMMVGSVDWLNEKNIALIKKYIAEKRTYNQDYLDLLTGHKVVHDEPVGKKGSNSALQTSSGKKKSAGENLLRAIETEVNLNVDEEKFADGEINMTNFSKKDFKKRRAVNLDYNEKIE